MFAEGDSSTRTCGTRDAGAGLATKPQVSRGGRGPERITTILLRWGVFIGDRCQLQRRRLRTGASKGPFPVVDLHGRFTPATRWNRRWWRVGCGNPRITLHEHHFCGGPHHLRPFELARSRRSRRAYVDVERHGPLTFLAAPPVWPRAARARYTCTHSNPDIATGDLHGHGPPRGSAFSQPGIRPVPPHLPFPSQGQEFFITGGASGEGAVLKNGPANGLPPRRSTRALSWRPRYCRAGHR